eukprot:3170882-Pyramimonas_sp.AAC.1
MYLPIETFQSALAPVQGYPVGKFFNVEGAVKPTHSLTTHRWTIRVVTLSYTKTLQSHQEPREVLRVRTRFEGLTTLSTQPSPPTLRDHLLHEIHKHSRPALGRKLRGACFAAKQE